MFGLSLSFLPFIGSSSAPDTATSGVDVMDEPGTDGPVVLSYEAVEELGRKLDDLRARTVADLGQEDRDYIFKIIKAQRGLEVAGRGLMYFGFFRRPGSPPSAP